MVLMIGGPGTRPSHKKIICVARDNVYLRELRRLIVDVHYSYHEVLSVTHLWLPTIQSCDGQVVQWSHLTVEGCHQRDVAESIDGKIAFIIGELVHHL